MEKLVYVLSPDARVSGDALRAELLEKAARRLRAAGAARISVNACDAAVAAGAAVTIANHRPPIRAMVSFWMENADDRAPCEAALAQEGQTLEGYLVAESRPLIHELPKGERAPGANVVTCIRRRPGLDDERFFDLWNREHKKVALEIQSTFAYVRNAVLRPLTPGAAPLDGVVEESFPIEALTDPKAWYDCDADEELERRVKRMVESASAFLDLSRIDSTPMSQYFLG